MDESDMIGCYGDTLSRYKISEKCKSFNFSSINLLLYILHRVWEWRNESMGMEE